MKIRFLYSFLLCFVFGSLLAHSPDYTIEVLSEDASSILFEVQMNDYSFERVSTDEGEYFIPGFSGAARNLNLGQPDLPSINPSFAIEFDDLLTFEVLSSEHIDLASTPVAPSKGNILRDTDPSTIAYPFGDVYDQDQYFPKQLIHEKAAYVFRSVKGQSVKIFPMQYNPASESIRVHTRLLIKASKNTDAGFKAPAVVPPVNVSFENIFKERFINFQSTENRYEYTDEYGGILVLMNSEYDEVMAPYITWKRQKGHEVFVANTDDFGTDLTAVQEYVASMYAEKYISYVIIVGDEDQVTSELFLGFGDGYCDNCYGYLAGDDHYPEVLIGRLITHNAEELAPVIEKLMEYEISPNTDKPQWFSTAIGAGSQEGPGDNGEYDFEHMNIIKELLLDFTYEEVYEFYEGDQSSSSPTPGSHTSDDAEWPGVSELLAVIEGQGTSLYNYVGHGSHGILVTGGLNSQAIDAMVNTGAYPFCIAVACCVGDFDESDGTGDCFGERWMKATDEATGAPTGGIGGLFSSVLQSWSPPMAGQDEMNRIIAGSAAYKTRHSFGSILVHGGGYMIDQYQGGGEDMMDTWCLFGDPTMEIRTAFPQQLTVTHIESVFIGTSSITVSSNTEDAMIGLYYRGESVGTGYIENGQTTIEIKGEGLLSPEDIIVTATAFNTIPYQGTISVIPAEGPYVILTEARVNDVAGNNNGLADHAERFALDIDLQNVGVETATNVRLTISSSDDKVSITQDASQHGNIIADELHTQLENFEIQVAEGVEDGYVVPFGIKIEADGHEWNSSLQIKLNAPELKVGAITIDDATTGNGNGRMDADETVLISVENYNVGSSDIQDIIGTLSSSSAGINISSPDSPIAQIMGDNGNMITTYEVFVDAAMPYNQIVDFQYLVGDEFYDATGAEEFRANLIIEDFENDETGHPFTFDESIPWFRTDQNPYKGEYCLQSGTIGHDASTYHTLTIDVLEAGPCFFSFRTDSEGSYDFLYFSIDGERMDGWSGNKDWSEVSYDLTVGEHTLVWEYYKDEIISSGEDAVWIDDIILPPYQEITPSNVEEARLDAVQIYPNPAIEVLTIASKDQAITGIQITSLSGSLIQNHILGNQNQLDTYNLNIENIPAGIYLIKVHTDQRTITEKIVIK